MSSLPKTLDDALIHVVKHATDKNMQDSLKLIKELILYNQLFPSECKEHEWWTELTKYQDYIKPVLEADADIKKV